MKTKIKYLLRASLILAFFISFSTVNAEVENTENNVIYIEENNKVEEVEEDKISSEILEKIKDVEYINEEGAYIELTPLREWLKSRGENYITEKNYSLIPSELLQELKPNLKLRVSASANGAYSAAYTSSGAFIYGGSIIKGSDGTELYCVDSAKKFPNGNGYTRKEVYDEQGMWALIRKGKEIGAKYAEIQVAVHTYLAEIKGATSYVVEGVTLKTSYTKQNAKVKTLVDYGKANNKVAEAVKVNVSVATAGYDSTIKKNIVRGIKIDGFSGKYSISNYPSDIEFYLTNTNTRVDPTNITAGTVFDIAFNNISQAKDVILTVNPTTASKHIGIYWNSTNSTYQRLARFKSTDPVENGTFRVTAPAVTGSVELNKMMDGNSLYGGSIKDNKTLYDTDTTDLKYYNNYTNKMLTYPSKEEFQSQNLSGKPIVYDAIRDEPVMKTVNKLDANGEKIPVVDEENNPVLDDQGNPVYETEIIQDTLEDGTPIYRALQDAEGNYLYEKITLNKTYPSLEEMENNYKANSDVKFGLYDESKTVKIAEKSALDGVIKFDNVPPGTYWIKEEETEATFILSLEWYRVVVTDGSVVKIKNGDPIWNYQEIANFMLKKVDSNKTTPIANIPFIFYKEINGVCDTTPIATKFTDNNGELYVSGLPGNYCYREGSTAYNYYIDPTVYKLTAINGQTIEHIRTNKFIDVTLQIDKVDELKKSLANAKFNVSFADTVFLTDDENNPVLDEDGEKIVLDEYLTDIKNVISDENGKIEINFNYDLKYFNDLTGKPKLIKITELEAPEGKEKLKHSIYGYIIYENGEFKFVKELEPSYVIPAHILETDVTDTIANVEIVNKDLTNDIYVSKVDAIGGQELEGAELCIYKINNVTNIDEEIDCWISEKEPHFAKLSYGEYFIEEHIAPPGYYISDIVAPFDVTEEGVKQYVNFENTPIPLANNELPKTGSNDLSVISYLFLATITTLGISYVLKKQI